MKKEYWRTLCIIAVIFSLSMLVFEGTSYLRSSSSPSSFLLQSQNRLTATSINVVDSRSESEHISHHNFHHHSLKEEEGLASSSSLSSSAGQTPLSFHQTPPSLVSSHNQPPSSSSSSSSPPSSSSSSSHASHHPVTSPSSQRSLPSPPSLSSQALLPSRIKLMANTSNSQQCNAKYPPHTLRMLATTIKRLGVRKVAIAGLFKDCAHILPTMDAVLQQVIFYLGARNVFVSFFESRSSDNGLTASLLQQMGRRLQVMGVSNVISFGDAERLPMQRDWREHKKGNRIDYLSKLRNVALLPILEAFPSGYFDKVFFVNDVYLCGGDILRLLAHNADIACGLDFKNGRFYDTWVMEQLQSPTHSSHRQHNHQSTAQDPLSTTTTASWDLSLKTPVPPLPFSTDAEEASRRVLACWNGGVAFTTAPLYRGVRFRRGMTELAEGDCSQSECSLWSMDFHNLGYHRIIVDPSVQLAYDRDEYNKWFRQPRITTQRTVQAPAALSAIHGEELDETLTLFNENTTYRCCEIEGASRQVDFSKCSRRKLRLSVHTSSPTSSSNVSIVAANTKSLTTARPRTSKKGAASATLPSSAFRDKCRRNAALCLKYTPARWVVHWDWRQWMLIGSPITTNSTATSTNTSDIPSNGHTSNDSSLLTPLELPQSLSMAPYARRVNKKKPKLLVIERGL